MLFRSPRSVVEAEIALPTVPAEVPLTLDPSPAVATHSIESFVPNPPPETEISIVEPIAPNPINLHQILTEEVVQHEPSVAATPPTDRPLVTIIQSELAKRLDVHSSTVYKRRSEPNFTDWTRNRDPEGLAWGYTEETKEYYRVDV